MPLEQDLTAPRPPAALPPAIEPKPGGWAAFWRKVFYFQAEKMAPWIGVRNTLGVTLPLALCAAFGAASTGLAIGTGALNVSFSDSGAPYIQRVRRMLAASFLVGVAVFAGVTAAHNPLLALALALSWAFASGILVALSATAADLGLVSLVTMLVYSVTPLPLPQAAFAGLLAFGGGLFQTVVALVLWPIRPYAPERRALADLYLELSRAAASAVNVYQPPPATAQSTSAQESLASLDREHSIEAARYRLLLSEAERLRLGLLLLARLRNRMRKEGSAEAEIEILDRFLDACSRILRFIGNSLLTGEPVTAFAEDLLELDELAEKLHDLSGGTDNRPPSVLALAADAQLQADAVMVQLRASVDLVTSSTPAGLVAFERRESHRPWKLRLAGTFAMLRANLSLKSAACRHAIRLAAAVVIADGVARGLNLPRSYWLPMTVAIVLKPDFAATFSRGVLRLAGTFAGLALATALFHVLPSSVAWQIALIAILMFVLRGIGPANYGLFAVAVTALVVLLFALAGIAPREVIAARAVNTAAGGAIALLIYGLWPTWERTQVPDVFAQTLDAFRQYFHVIRESYEKPGRSFRHDLDRTRRAGRLARANLEASIDRLSVEPNVPRETSRSLSAALAGLYRLAYAMMALEAGLASSPPVPPRRPFHKFANDVEHTLQLLAGALRRTPLDRAALPGLRADHRALIHSGVALTERYALVNVETDRIVSSLDTLTEELLQWLTTSP